MPDPRITAHAIERFQERVANVSADEARETLTSLTRQAAAFGAPYVRLGTGQRIVINDGAVITVLPDHTRPGTLGRRER